MKFGALLRTRSDLGTRLSSSKSAFVYQISKSDDFFVKMAIKRFAIWRPSAVLSFRNTEFVSRDLYGHAILLSCAKFH